MSYPYFIIIYVVSRCYLQTPGAELHIDILVKNERHWPVCHWNDDLFTSQSGISLVCRVGTNGRVAENSLRARCGNCNIVIFTLNPVFYVIELRLLLSMVYLLVRNGGPGLRVPVDHPHSPVNKTFIMQVNKYFNHRVISLLIHREEGAAPVA